MGSCSGLATDSEGAGVQMAHQHHHGAHQQNADAGGEADGAKRAQSHFLRDPHRTRYTCHVPAQPPWSRPVHAGMCGTRTSHARNFFDFGVVRKCRDFWTMGKELGVEYGWVYDVPLEGFDEAKKHKEAERDNDHDGGSNSSRSKSLLGNLSMRMGMGSSRRGYEPLNQV